ncbi:MAG: erythrose-4-phosphate dehydrogenase [unclassified Hahellaceae]|nr:erythrose-4-phosphate dehydrogenase [Hahellaceae bacterium]|tara:strand:+ start:13716 stop:14837 length:1122 start_codon:yes stop_codon:yes gene_type:complete
MPVKDIRLAINGYGRIGQCVLRALYESGHREAMQVVAINDLAATEAIAYLTEYDTTHGPFPGEVRSTRGADGQPALIVNGDCIRLFDSPDVKQLPWADLEVDLVLECTGVIRTREGAEQHLQQGADAVLISNPAEASVDATIVYGVNESQLDRSHTIVSNASCTTNSVVPVIAALDKAFGVRRGSVTTVHAAMNDQPLIDAWQPGDLRKTRSGMASIVPVSTELAKGIERLLPSMAERFVANAIRVPVMNGSLIDLTVQLDRAADAAAVNRVLAAATHEYCGVVSYTEAPLISTDFNHDPHSAIIDGSQTCVSDGYHCKVMIWFDNEWGFANRMLDVARYWLDDAFRAQIEVKKLEEAQSTSIKKAEVEGRVQ